MDSQPVTNMAQSQQHAGEEKTFNFFGLPQELQDLIYLELASNTMCAIKGRAPFMECTYLVRYPAIQPRLVSRRFKDRYDKITNELEHKVRVVALFEGIYNGVEELKFCHRPGILRNATKAEVEVITECDTHQGCRRTVAEEDDECEHRTESFYQVLEQRLPNLRDATIGLHCSEWGCSTSCLEMMISRLADVPKDARFGCINKVELYIGSAPAYDTKGWDVRDARLLLAQWTRTGGLKDFGLVENYFKPIGWGEQNEGEDEFCLEGDFVCDTYPGDGMGYSAGGRLARLARLSKWTSLDG